MQSRAERRGAIDRDAGLKRGYGIGLPATAAFRADLATNRDMAGEVPAAWLAVASLVEHAGQIDSKASDALLRRATRLAKAEFGRGNIGRLAEREWGSTKNGGLDAIVLLADVMARADMLHLAGATLDSLLASDRSASVTQAGRILAKRARVAWKLGNLDEAQARYRIVEKLGRQVNSAELKARAVIGYAALAQMRGNYPEVERQSRRAVRFAKAAGIRALAKNAYSGLLISAAVGGALDDALRHGWKVYEASAGDPVEEGEVLQNLGQALLRAGHSRTARAVFASVIARPLPSRIMLPALGGFAVASAELERSGDVLWAARQVRAVRVAAVPRYALASALLECSAALIRVDEDRIAEVVRERAVALAVRHGFHEISYHAEQLASRMRRGARAAPERLRRTAAAVVRELESMEPTRLPDRVLVTVGSDRG